MHNISTLDISLDLNRTMEFADFSIARSVWLSWRHTITSQIGTHFVFPFLRLSNFGGDDCPPSGDELSDSDTLGATFDTDAIDIMAIAVVESRSPTNGWFTFASNIFYIKWKNKTIPIIIRIHFQIHDHDKYEMHSAQR